MRVNSTIQQVLHGYEEGHRLLASSTKLSSSEQNYLLELTDLSGQYTPNFDEYLTGYPIPQSDKYAFSKTWYAAEMPRPGCVWTHTLLIEKNAFSKIFDLQDLLNYFQRPQKGKYIDYKEPILYTSDILNGETLSPLTINSSVSFDKTNSFFSYSNIYHNIFEKLSRVVIVAEDSLIYEKLVLSIWNQMWSSLRARFTFCTGSLSNRKIKNESFILQVSPEQNLSSFQPAQSLTRQFEKNKGSFVLFDSRKKENVRNLESKRYYYLYNSFQEPLFLEQNSDEEYILRFIWYFGEQMIPFKKNFGWLTRLFEMLKKAEKSLEDIDGIAKAISNKFPLKEEQIELKSCVFGGDGSFKEQVELIGDYKFSKPLSNEHFLLEYLLQTEYINALPINKLNLPERFKTFWMKSPQIAETLLDNLSKVITFNEIQLLFLKITAKFISENQFVRLLDKKSSVPQQILTHNSNLANNQAIWKLSEDEQSRVFSLLKTNFEKESDSKKQELKWQKVTHSMLDANNDIFAKELYKMFGETLIKWTIEWISKNQRFRISAKWESLLFENPRLIVEQIINNKSSVMLKTMVAQNLISLDIDVKTQPVSFWLELAETDKNILTEFERLQIYGFMLSIGLSSLNQESIKLIINSFDEVYQAAWYNVLPQHIWEQIEQFVPGRGFIFSWDRCHRLEEAIVSLFLDKKFPIEMLFEVSKSRLSLTNLIKRMDTHSRGRKLLWKLKDKIEDEKIKINKSQMDVFESYFS
jgi:GTPase-associated protein 1, N-terminal domain type 1